MLLKLAYLGVTNALTLLRLLPMSDREKDAEILALRHQIGVLQRQLGTGRPAFEAGDRAFLAALLTPLPRTTLRRLRLIVRRWSVFAIPLPLWLAPGGDSYEYAADGRFHFHVEIGHPWTGLIVR